MRSRFMLAAAALALAACQPPAQAPQTPDTAQNEQLPPGVEECNDVAPNMARLVSVQDPIAAAAQATLAGGPIAPGIYDLVSATRIGQATGWADPRAAALDVSEGGDGVLTFNWASAPAGGQADRWSASFTDTPTPRLTYTCGRIGAVDAAFAVEGGNLQLRLPDGGAGSLDLVLARRG
ncbi:MAG TPA: hypothetical protein PLK37_07100 [Terricaulis sp.]|nr:hypothetical protein [Terricaulis sp.]